MSELTRKGKKGLILLIDFEKAFDSLEWGYIFKVLKAYNFGKDFIKWIKVLYNDPCSCVINNGFFSQQFLLERGCRQGDPLSPYIFILAIEPLAMDIKNNNNIRGIKIKKAECKIGQYADDTFLLLQGEDSSLKECLKLFMNCIVAQDLKSISKRLKWPGLVHKKL